MKKELDIHFFTIVLNGMPFIDKHIDTFLKISPNWHWHIVEGVASLVNDTSWPLFTGGAIDNSLHINGLSKDGTSEYIDALKNQYPEKVSIYRKPDGIFWHGKKEMVNTPLQNISDECLLWEIDVDEFWTPDQINTGHRLFSENPNKFAAYYWADYFVGPKLAISSRNGYANNPKIEWERTWRFLPHFRWASHEPPTLVEKTFSGEIRATRNRGYFSHAETEHHGLVFQHYAYVFKEQLEFKEKYYGYKGAEKDWLSLQRHPEFPTKLANFFSWVTDNTTVDTIESLKIKPIINLE